MASNGDEAMHQNLMTKLSEYGGSHQNLSEVLQHTPSLGVQLIEAYEQIGWLKVGHLLDLLPEALEDDMFEPERSPKVPIECFLAAFQKKQHPEAEIERSFTGNLMETCHKLRAKGWRFKAADASDNLLGLAYQSETEMLKQIHAVMEPMEATDGELLASMLDNLPTDERGSECLQHAMVLFHADYLKDVRSNTVPLQAIYHKFEQHGQRWKEKLMQGTLKLLLPDMEPSQFSLNPTKVHANIDQQAVGQITDFMALAIGGKKDGCEEQVLRLIVEQFKRQTDAIPPNLASICKFLLEASLVHPGVGLANVECPAKFMPRCWVQQYQQGRDLDIERVTEVFETLFNILGLKTCHKGFGAPDFSEVEDMAARWQLWKLVKILADRSCRVNNETSLAMNAALSWLILANGASTSQDERVLALKSLCRKGRCLGWSPTTTNAIFLHVVSEGSINNLQNLIQFKADVNAINFHPREGWETTSPLRFACRQMACHPESFESMKKCVKQLIESRADVAETGERGCKPLMEICQGNPRQKPGDVLDFVYDLSSDMRKSQQGGDTAKLREELREREERYRLSGIEAIAYFLEKQAPPQDNPELLRDHAMICELPTTGSDDMDVDLGVRIGKMLLEQVPDQLFQASGPVDTQRPGSIASPHENFVSLWQLYTCLERAQQQNSSISKSERQEHLFREQILPEPEGLPAVGPGDPLQASEHVDMTVGENELDRLKQILHRSIDSDKAAVELMNSFEDVDAFYKEAKAWLAKGRSTDCGDHEVDDIVKIVSSIPNNNLSERLLDEGKQVHKQLEILLRSRQKCLRSAAKARGTCTLRTKKALQALYLQEDLATSKRNFEALFDCLKGAAYIGLIPLPDDEAQSRFTQVLQIFMGTMIRDLRNTKGALEMVRRLQEQLSQLNDPMSALVQTQEKGGFGVDSLEKCCAFLQKRIESFQERAYGVLKSQEIGKWSSLLDSLDRMTSLLDILPTESPEVCIKLLQDRNKMEFEGGLKPYFEYVKDCLLRNDHQLVPKAILDRCKDPDFQTAQKGAEDLKQELQRIVSGDKPHLKYLLESTSQWTEGIFEKLQLRVVLHQTQHAALLLAMKFFDDIKAGAGPGQAAKCLIEEIGTGEGKSVVIAMLALYIATEGKPWHGASTGMVRPRVRVHVLIDNINQLERDFMEFIGMFESFLPGESCIVMSGEEYTKRKELKRKVVQYASEDGKIPLNKAIVYCQAKHVQSLYAQLAQDMGEKKPMDFTFNVFQDAVILLDEVDSLIIDENINDPYLFKCDQDLGEFARRAAGDLKDGTSNVKPSNQMQRRAYAALAETFKKVAGCTKDKNIEVHHHDGNNPVVQYFQRDEHDERKAYKEVIKGKLEIDSWSLMGECLTYKFADSGDAKFEFKETLFVASRPSVIKGYRAIFGLSGSVGSDGDRKFIKDVYNATFASIPRFLEVCDESATRRYQVPKCRGIFSCDTKEKLYDKIAELASTCAQKKGVPVLVITRAADEARLISRHCESRRDLWVKRQPELDGEETSLFVRDLSWHQYEADHITYEKYIESACQPRLTELEADGKARSSKVWPTTVTDGKGGRGTDYRCEDPEVETLGGFMLILVNPPTNVRDLIQWLGRSARQGNAGQFIIIYTAENYEHCSLEACVTPSADPGNPLDDNDFQKEFDLFRKEMQKSQAELDAVAHQKARLEYWKGEIMCELSKTCIGETDTSTLEDYLFSEMCMSFQNLTMKQIFSAMHLRKTPQPSIDKLFKRSKSLMQELMINEAGIDISLPVKEQCFPWPRLFVLMLDRTMQQTACERQIEAVQQVIQNEVYVSEQDRVGVYSLGDGWMLSPQPVKDRANRQSLVAKLDTYKFPAGTPCLWESLLYCAKTMYDCIASCSHPLRCSLLIVTDLVDDGLRFGGRFPQPGMTCLLSQGTMQKEFKIGNYKRSSGVKLPSSIDLNNADVAEVAFNHYGGPLTALWLCDVQPMASETPPDDLKSFLAALTKAGTRNGQVTISCGWAAKHDLDLHVYPKDKYDSTGGNLSNEGLTKSGISYKNRCIEEGNFIQVLDTDMTATEPPGLGDREYRVENIFMDNIPNSNHTAFWSKRRRYVVGVHNFSGENSTVEFLVVVRTSPQIRLQIHKAEGGKIETFGNSLSERLYTFKGTMSKPKAFKPAFEFEILERSDTDNIQADIEDACTSLISECAKSCSASFDACVVDISSPSLSTWLPKDDPPFYQQISADRRQNIKEEREAIQEATKNKLRRRFGEFRPAKDQKEIAKAIMDFCGVPAANFGGATL
eukprot:TRINITY_DN15951_c0_g1_i1.p1 TRINITY_DN15951_c0_g1~~TRINITY_DN15951_c0_g1_i1.p1  ORF type:complete len:2279 (-),score=383.88 TRINITY_DN15951_c0_g1_i1:110-6946(-)